MSDVFIILLLAIIVLLAILIGIALAQNKRWTLRDIWDLASIILLIVCIILLPIGAGTALFLWLSPIGFWQTLAAFIFMGIVIIMLYGLELVIIAIFA